MVLFVLRQAKNSLNLKKCTLFTDIIYFLGHFIPFGALYNALHTLEDISGRQNPTNFSTLKSFVPFSYVYWQFVPRFALISIQLNKNLAKGELWNRTEMTTDSLNALDDF